MKLNKFLSYTLVGLGFAALASCSDDRDSNPTIVKPAEGSLVLNTPSYANQTIELINSDSLSFTWSQPNYTDMNAPISVTYEFQVSATGSFTVSYDEAEDDESLTADYGICDEKFNTICHGSVPAKSFTKAINKSAHWEDESSVPANMELSVRLVSYILEGTKKLYPVYSSPIKLKVVPYYIELSNEPPMMWYLLGGCFGDASWSNDPANTGKGNFPFFLIENYAYNKKTGAGEISYINFIPASGEFKILPGHNMTDDGMLNWDYAFVEKDGVPTYRDGGPDGGNLKVDKDGIYEIKINTGTNTCTIDPYDAGDVQKYDQICIAGGFNDWSDTEMTAVGTGSENHVWCYVMENTSDDVIQYKFKIKGSWDTNWGYGENDGDVNTIGTCTGGGKNIGIGKGTWVIMFNDITGEFNVSTKPAKPE